MTSKNKVEKNMTNSQNFVFETELILVQQTRLEIARKRKSLSEMEAMLEQQEHMIMEKIKNGAEIEGNMNASIELKKGPARPKWKEEYVSHMEAEHGISPKIIQAQMQEKYPGSESEVLVISLKTE